MTHHEKVTAQEQEIREALSDSMQRGSAKAIASALSWPKQRVHEALAGDRPTPHSQVIRWTEAEIASGNPEAREPVIALCRLLGLTAFRNEAATDDQDFAAVLREVADVINEKANAEADGAVSGDEYRAIARQAAELSERAAAYAAHALSCARKADAKLNVRRIS